MDGRIFELYIKRVLESFINNYGFTSHQRESYEHFLHFFLPTIIEEHFPINVHCAKLKILHRVFLDGFYFKKPTMCEPNMFYKTLTPTEACERKQTYYFDVFLNVTHKVYRGTPEKFSLVTIRKFKNLLLCKVPCMVGSTACHLHENFNASPQRDFGNFIVNGYQKTIICQEHVRPNYPYVFRAKGKNTHRLEIRSLHAEIIRSTSTLQIFITAEKAGSVSEIQLVVPFFKKPISLVTIFKLFGILNVKEMLNLILGSRASEQLKYHAESILLHDFSAQDDNKTQDELFDYIGMFATQQQKEKKKPLNDKKNAAENLQEEEKLTKNTKRRRIQYAKNVFQNEFFPHCGKDYSTPESAKKVRSEKMFFLGYCVRKLLRVAIKELPPDDIDDYRNKRCCSAGLQFALLIRQLIRIFIQTIHAQIFKNTEEHNANVNLIDFFKTAKISAGLRYACATGNWGIQKTMTNQSGVSQVLNETNLTSRISHQRQVNTPLNRDGKAAQPRQLHETHLGLHCSFETPEGKAVGLVHQLGLLTRIRTGYPTKIVMNLLQTNFDIIPYQQDLTLVLLNGIIIGGVADPQFFISKFKIYRQHHSLPIDISISFDKEISILVDAEACTRPLIRLENLHKLPKLYQLYGQYLHLFWNQLLIEGVIDYISKDEEHLLHLAISYDKVSPIHSHLELDPSVLLFGGSAGIIPFPEFNQSPRTIYQSSMGKQSIGVQSFSFREHFANKTHVLNYGHKPSVTTAISQYIGYDDEPAGEACVVALVLESGFNQDDSIILSQAAVDRGMFRSTCYRCTRECEVRHGTDEERFSNDFDVSNVQRKRKGDSSKLEANGMVAPGTHVEQGDILIHKTTKDAQGHKYDVSSFSKAEERLLVEQVMISTTKDDLQTVSMRFSSQRTPEMGDKFSSRHGQKGIAGLIVSQEDMIYTREGIVPDIQVNIHAIPSRMTLGHLLESYLGKISAIEGQYIDGTAFRNIDFDNLNTISNDHYGKEVMYDGKTGQRLQNKVFLGIIFYQRLKHMVQDKVHSRRTGPNQVLTRQAAEGRGKHGGFRFGEMEKNSIVSHGSAAILQERLLHSSDKFTAVVCNTCGFFAELAAPKGTLTVTHKTHYCRFCDSHDNIYPVQLPFAAKLLFSELYSLHLFPKITLE